MLLCLSCYTKVLGIHYFAQSNALKYAATAIHAVENWRHPQINLNGGAPMYILVSSSRAKITEQDIQQLILGLNCGNHQQLTTPLKIIFCNKINYYYIILLYLYL